MDEYEWMILPLMTCDTLSEWEYDFIHDIAELDWLSDRQVETLEKIYERQQDYI